MSLLSQLPNPTHTVSEWPWNIETSPLVYDQHKHWPKISIITPSYNQGRFIEETIRSVLLQNYPNLEYIIIDGGSTDNSVEIIKKYEQWITYWVSEKDNGQSHAINKGYDLASGEIINWLNSDDLLVQNSLFFVASCFLLNPNLDWVTGFRIVRNIDNISLKFENHWEHRWLFYLLGVPDFPQEATFLSQKVVKKIGKIDESLHFLMDVEFYYRLLKEFPQGAFIRHVLSIMNAYDEQKTMISDPRKKDEYDKVTTAHKPKLLKRIALRVLGTRFYDIVLKVLEMMLTRVAKKRYAVYVYSSNLKKVEKVTFTTNYYGS